MSIWNMLEKRWNICVSLKFQPLERSGLAVGKFCGEWRVPFRKPLPKHVHLVAPTCCPSFPAGLTELSTKGAMVMSHPASLGKRGPGTVGKVVASLQDELRKRVDSSSWSVGSYGPAPRGLSRSSRCLVSVRPVSPNPAGQRTPEPLPLWGPALTMGAGPG